MRVVCLWAGGGACQESGRRVMSSLALGCKTGLVSMAAAEWGRAGPHTVTECKILQQGDCKTVFSADSLCLRCHLSTVVAPTAVPGFGI